MRLYINILIGECKMHMQSMVKSILYILAGEKICRIIAAALSIDQAQ